jgi:ferredoxin
MFSLSNLKEEAQQVGLNLVGVADGRPYQHLLPDCQTAIVFANGGRDLWTHFLEDLRANPSHLTETAHPLDDFIGRWIQSVDPNPDSTRRWIQCAEEADVFIDFRPLAVSAGLGTSSLLGLIIHPEYGLWVSMRAVLLSTEILEATTTKTKPSPCVQCVDRPCISACPANAVTLSGWSVQQCATFHGESTLCANQCHSRQACPVGVSHRHSDLQHTYHSNRQIGRTALSETLGVHDIGSSSTIVWNDWT